MNLAAWGRVYGEPLAFDAPKSRLPTIDRMEGLHPGGPCLYHRVLVPVQVNGTVLPVWFYVGKDPISGRLTPIVCSRWPR